METITKNDEEQISLVRSCALFHSILIAYQCTLSTAVLDGGFFYPFYVSFDRTTIIEGEH
jgi:hypothetical protein